MLWGLGGGAEAGGGDWKGEALYEQERGSQAVLLGWARGETSPLYELPRRGQAGEARNGHELGKTWPEAMLPNRTNSFLLAFTWSFLKHASNCSYVQRTRDGM